MDQIKILKIKSFNLGYDGIPDKIPTRLNNCRDIPNWKQIAIDILNNDFGKKKKSKYYNLLKRIEIDAREKKGSYQIKMF